MKAIIKPKIISVTVCLRFPEEARFIKTCIQNRIGELNLPEEFLKERQHFLSKAETKSYIKLYRYEILLLHEYWTIRCFNEGKGDGIGRRLSYLERLLGRRDAKKQFERITTELHQGNVIEDDEAQDVPFPPFFGDSDYGD